MLPLLLYWLSSRAKKVLMLCKYWAAMSHIFFMWNENFDGICRSCCRPKQHPSLSPNFLSVIGLWVKIWHRNKTTCFWSNPVQSSRSKSRTCLRKGHLLRLALNSTAASNGGKPKLGNNVWLDSESIANKVWLQARPVANEMSHVVTSLDRMRFYGLGQQWSKKCFRSCDRNSGFSHDLIFVEVSEWDDILWFIIFSVCKQFGSW